ncbi:hypothetical protein THAOC_02637 [Thalassiosira oceanica]|uniref:Uncharacterized protein n=1 Tax=Thalassiosira oceanica TaxID=159749 RepID=K0TDZ7_THAOC|nr:hypothetical protein THAOC_02637 [Thalassiosira oceanica]|eukprot:EJK75635.1 hypothetical protein THAOC_02637 [Thalassiosira oceanica]
MYDWKLLMKIKPCTKPHHPPPPSGLLIVSAGPKCALAQSIFFLLLLLPQAINSGPVGGSLLVLDSLGGTSTDGWARFEGRATWKAESRTRVASAHSVKLVSRRRCRAMRNVENRLARQATWLAECNGWPVLRAG